MNFSITWVTIASVFYAAIGSMKFLAPRYWGIWLGLGVLRLIVLLPYRWQLALGRFLGRASLPFSPYRRHITEVNFRLCYPELCDAEREELVIKSFESVGMGMIESAMAWWMPDRRLKHLAHYAYPASVQALVDGQAGVLFCGAHYTCLELVGRLMALRFDYHLMYRRHRNPLFNKIMTEKRASYVGKVIPRKKVRELLRSLRKGKSVWYAPDQDYGAKHSVFAPFFGIQAASITATSSLARLGKAKVVPVFYHRLPDGKGYELIVKEPFDNFPSGDDIADAARFNQLLEEDLKQHPDQYLWQHRRFKTRPQGEEKLYRSKKEFKIRWLKW